MPAPPSIHFVMPAPPSIHFVMPAHVAGIHVLLSRKLKNVDGGGKRLSRR